MSFIPPYRDPVPRLTTDQMVEVDRLMIEEYRIELVQMMENAGRCLAILSVQRFLKKELKKKRVIVLAGTGGNGGGALACARRLHNWGTRVNVFLSDEDDHMTPVPRHQLQILRRIGLEIDRGHELGGVPEADLVIDGIIGYSIKGDPYGLPREMIDWANTQRAPVLSLDTPSGLDLTSGTPYRPTVQASATLTLALPKKGLFAPGAADYVGELYLGDISVPPELYGRPSLNIEVDHRLFAQSDVVKLPRP